MKQYRFKMQTLLDIACQRERSTQQELARAHAAEAEARRRLEAAAQMCGEWEQRLRARQRGSLDPQGLRAALGAVEAAQRRVTCDREAVRAAERAAEMVRERLTEAARDRKSLERLREQSREEYGREELAQAVKISDDMAGSRAAVRCAQPHLDSVLTGAHA